MTDNPGSLQRVSPEEPAHALLFSIQEAIQAGHGDDILKRWRALLLSSDMVFEVIAPGDARYWRALNLREEVSEKHVVLSRSLRQRVFDIAGFKNEKDKETGVVMSSEKVSKLYRQHVKFASSTEAVSTSFVDSALTIYRRVLHIQENHTLLEWCDATYMDAKRNPFSSISTLQALVDRARAPELITLALRGLVDAYRMEQIEMSQFAVGKIRDPRESYVEVLNFKHAMKKELLGPWLDDLNVPGHVKEVVRQTFNSFTAVRGSITGYPGDATVDTLSWMAQMPESGSRLMDFLEDRRDATLHVCATHRALCNHSGAPLFAPVPCPS